MCLGVIADFDSHCDICFSVNIGMTNTIQVFNHRYARFSHQASNQALTAARHDHINVLGHRDHLPYGSAISSCHDLHSIFRQACCCKALLDNLRQQSIGINGFRATAQNDSIARFQTKSGSINRDIRTRLVNDPNHA